MRYGQKFLPGGVGWFFGVMSAAMWGLAGVSALAADIEWLGENSGLPEGMGLAAAFPGDLGIANHPEVIFADNFEENGLENRWDSQRNDRGDVLAWVAQKPADPRLGGRSLEVTATLGRNTGGGFTRWFESADILYIRFYTWFRDDCDYIHHFCTLRANRGLKGEDRWSGFGGAGERPAGDRRFSTAIEPWGNWGRWPAPGRWNFYSYWHTMERSRDGHYWGNSFRPETQPNIQKGRWICVEFSLKHNTPGEPDGEQAFWIDGDLRGHWRGFNWRTDPHLRANAFTLESYVTDRWTQHRTNTVRFDNVVIARDYIGPTVPAEPKDETGASGAGP